MYVVALEAGETLRIRLDDSPTSFNPTYMAQCRIRGQLTQTLGEVTGTGDKELVTPSDAQCFVDAIHVHNADVAVSTLSIFKNDTQIFRVQLAIGATIYWTPTGLHGWTTTGADITA